MGLQHSIPLIVLPGMNKWRSFIFRYYCNAGCGHRNKPDVSGIKADATIARFDKDFFAADTSHIIQSLDAVQKKYPWFFTDFIQNIVIGGTTDTPARITRFAECLYKSQQAVI